MTMQNNIDIVRRSLRRNMNQSKLQTFAHKVDNERPVHVPVAISAYHSQRRTDLFQIERDRRLAHIAQVPNLIRVRRHLENLLRQLIMSISENKYTKWLPHSGTTDDTDTAHIIYKRASTKRRLALDLHFNHPFNPRNPRLS
jgi:hypothetical protein